MNARKRTAVAAGVVLAAGALNRRCGGDDREATPTRTSTAPGGRNSRAGGRPGRKAGTPGAGNLGRADAGARMGGDGREGMDPLPVRQGPRESVAEIHLHGRLRQKWPPVLVHGKPAVKGVSSWIVGKVRRADGSVAAHPARLAGVPVRR